MATIKAIDQVSVHRLHSGQVVLDLQSAVKELVENAIDAGATSVDVRIKDNGLDSVEVTDNGSGIKEEDWEGVALKHYTSKLPSLEDLAHVETFGFRGEALSALCALCESVTIKTATSETAPMGAVLTLGRDGRLLSTSKEARSRGTTITLSGLFRPLPVRRKEFERTAKREFAKALGILTAYALVPASVGEGRKGVRLKVETLGSGRNPKRNTVLVTDGRGGVRASVSALWGAKALNGLLDVDLSFDVEVDRAMARREGIDVTSQAVRVTGLISSAAQGQGRASSDRQYTYINGRPCNLPQVMKAVNEVYKSYNISQVPLAVLDFRIAPESVDINVSPDKRTIFVHSERNLIAALREALDEFYAPSRSSFAVGGASHIGRMLSSQKPFINEEDDEDDDNGDDDGTNGIAAESESREKETEVEEIEDAAQEDGEEEDAEEIGDATTHRDENTDDEEPQPATRKRRPGSVVVTLDTTTASWSPQKRPRTSLRSKLQSYRSSATPAPVVATTGTDSEPESEQEPEAETAADAGDDNGDDVDMESSPVRAQRSTRLSLSSHLSRPPRQNSAKESPLQRFWDSARRRSRPEAGAEAEGGDEVVDVEAAQSSRPSRRIGAVAMGSAAHSERRSRREQSEEPEASIALASDSETEVEDVAIKISESQVQRPQHHAAQNSGRRGRQAHSRECSPIETAADETLEDEQPVLHIQEPTAEHESHARGHSSQEVDDLCCGSSSDVPAVGQPPPEEREAVHVDVDEEDTAAAAAGYRDEIASTLPASEVTLNFDMERLQRRWASLSLGPSSKPSADIATKLKKGQATSAASVQNRDLASAEAALSRSIDKADFARMRILGQFNRGFIIAALPNGDGQGEDLYIIDQHASDEKYNFETLQRSYRIQAQALLAPKVLQLSVADEITLLEHREVVERNGFELKYDPDGVPGRRVSLCAVPVSRDTVFDESDLAELIHRINDGHDNPRTSKARAMFAMRACRRSVMIGTALQKPKMEQLVRNMGTIDQPWNCPHGRPTMRHLTTVEPTDQSGRGRIDWSKVKL